MLPGHITDILKRNKVDRHINRPNKIFCHGNYQVIHNFLFLQRFLLMILQYQKSTMINSMNINQIKKVRSADKKFMKHMLIQRPVR